MERTVFGEVLEALMADRGIAGVHDLALEANDRDMPFDGVHIVSRMTNPLYPAGGLGGLADVLYLNPEERERLASAYAYESI